MPFNAPTKFLLSCLWTETYVCKTDAYTNMQATHAKNSCFWCICWCDAVKTQNNAYFNFSWICNSGHLNLHNSGFKIYHCAFTEWKLLNRAYRPIASIYCIDGWVYNAFACVYEFGKWQYFFFFKSSKNGGENVRIACRSVDCFVLFCVSHTISFACLRGICFLPVAFVHLENFVLKVSEWNCLWLCWNSFSISVMCFIAHDIFQNNRYSREKKRPRTVNWFKQPWNLSDFWQPCYFYR